MTQPPTQTTGKRHSISLDDALDDEDIDDTAIQQPAAKRIAKIRFKSENGVDAASTSPPWAEKKHSPRQYVATTLLGSAGQQYLSKQLSQQSPATVIPKLQHYYRVQLPQRLQKLGGEKQASVDAALRLCDSVGVRRHTVHTYCMNRLLRHMQQRIPTTTNSNAFQYDAMLSSNKQKLPPYNKDHLLQLLASTFPYISHDQLRSIPLQCMAALDKELPYTYMQQMGGDDQLLQLLPLELRTRVYESVSEAADRVFNQLIQQFCEQLDRSWPSIAAAEAQHQGSTEAPAASNVQQYRRTNTTLRDIVNVLNKSTKLYSHLAAMLEQLYAKTGNQQYCTLRYQLLMTLHESEETELVATESTLHSIIWLFDAALVNGLNAKVILQLQAKMTELKALLSHTAVSVTMILNCQFVYNYFNQRIQTSLQACVANNIQPHSHKQLRLYAEILYYACISHEMLQQKKLTPVTAKMLDTIIKDLLPVYVQAMKSDEQHNYTDLLQLPAAGSINNMFKQAMHWTYAVHAAKGRHFARLAQLVSEQSVQLTKSGTVQRAAHIATSLMHTLHLLSTHAIDADKATQAAVNSVQTKRQEQQETQLMNAVVHVLQLARELYDNIVSVEETEVMMKRSAYNVLRTEVVIAMLYEIDRLMALSSQWQRRVLAVYQSTDWGVVVASLTLAGQALAMELQQKVDRLAASIVTEPAQSEMNQQAQSDVMEPASAESVVESAQPSNDQQNDAAAAPDDDMQLWLDDN